MIARRILAAAAAAAFVLRATAPRSPVAGLDEETREHAFVDLDGPRASRQIHGLTASELAEADRRQAHDWARVEAELVGDADFRALAARLLDQFPDQT
jgi:hypothetical protein